MNTSTTNATPIVEIGIFKVIAGTTDAQVLSASAELGAKLREMPGFIDRELSKSADGEWLDILHWRTMAEAQTAGEQVMTWPCATAFMAMLDMSTLKLSHYSQMTVTSHSRAA